MNVALKRYVQKTVVSKVVSAVGDNSYLPGSVNRKANIVTFLVIRYCCSPIGNIDEHAFLGRHVQTL